MAIWFKVWAGLLIAVPPAMFGWIWADLEICAWTALGASVGAAGVGVWLSLAACS